MGDGKRRLLGWSVLAVFVLGLLGFLLVGAAGPEDPYLVGGGTAPGPGADGSPAGAGGPRVPVPGFGEVAFRVTSGPGAGLPASSEFCALLAATDAQRARGMMGRRDLAGYDAMVFRFDGDVTGAFYMRNVPVPLSIAWFDADGALVSTADMAPCADREGCPLYAAAGPYRVALEVLGGGLGRLGVGPGSVISVGGACPG